VGEFLAEFFALTPGEDTVCGRGRKEPMLSKLSRPLLLPYRLDRGFTGRLRLSVDAPRPLPVKRRCERYNMWWAFGE